MVKSSPDQLTRDAVLSLTVKGIINAVFVRLEKAFGFTLVDHIIGFLTFSKFGVSNVEMLDLLSMSDAVLDEVFQYSKLETVRRIPVHVWLRVRQELSPFLVEKTSGTLRWYHRQLWETAEERFTKEAQQHFHSLLGQYFASLVPEDVRRSRLIMSQDIILCSHSQPAAAFQQSTSSAVWYKDSVVNVRRCTEALYHLVQAGMFDEAMQEICDVRHVCAYLRAGQGYKVLEQLTELRKVRDIGHYFKWLQENMSALSMDPLNYIVPTALDQPLSSDCRRSVEQEAMPNGQLVWTCKRFGGWTTFNPNLLTILYGHALEGTCVCASSDGKRAISGSHDKTVKIWDLESGRCLTTLTGHDIKVSAVGIFSDDSRIVSGSEDGMMKIWDGQSGCCLKSWKGHGGQVSSVCFSRDSSKIISGAHDGTVKVWGMLSDDKCFHGHTNLVSSVCITSDGKTVVSGSHDETIRVRDADSGNCQTIPSRGKGKINAICLSCDDKMVISGSEHGVMYMEHGDAGLLVIMECRT